MKRTRRHDKRTTRRDDNVIGFDPLAWMKEPSAESGVLSAESTARATPETTVSPPSEASGTQNSTLRTQNTPSAIALGETLTIEQVAGLHSELIHRLGAGRVVLAANELARVDGAGLQLLAAFVRAAGERGTGVEWHAPSAALRDGARLLGLTVALGLGDDRPRAA